ncbi:hypothetical protein KBC55_01130 [Patescibacteria group bacterium]|nr:hypothetical protein [Patescibacteria group bacterium]
MNESHSVANQLERAIAREELSRYLVHAHEPSFADYLAKQQGDIDPVILADLATSAERYTSELSSAKSAAQSELCANGACRSPLGCDHVGFYEHDKRDRHAEQVFDRENPMVLMSLTGDDASLIDGGRFVAGTQMNAAGNAVERVHHLPGFLAQASVHDPVSLIAVEKHQTMHHLVRKIFKSDSRLPQEEEVLREELLAFIADGSSPLAIAQALLAHAASFFSSLADEERAPRVDAVEEAMMALIEYDATIGARSPLAFYLLDMPLAGFAEGIRAVMHHAAQEALLPVQVA